MSLITFDIFGYGHAGIPVSFSQTQVIGVDKFFDFLLDCFCIDGDVIFGEELFLSIIVEFIIFDGANLGRF